MKDVLEGALHYLESRRDSSLVNALAAPLVPLSWCYGLALSLRWSLEEFRSKLAVPCTVVSVGNMTVGGTGKTPMVAWVAQFFHRMGVRTAVVSHGYGARTSGSYVLLREQDPSPRVSSVAGDEAVLLSHLLGSVPVASGWTKASAVRRTWRALRPQVIVLDDGFQSISIRKDLEIVLVDATNPWGSGHLLPRGRLREPKQNLSRGDVVVITRCNQVQNTQALESEIRRLTRAPIVRGEHVLRGVWKVDSWEEAKPEVLEKAAVYAFSGVANPESFEQTLRETGVRLVGSKRFSDHHFFSAHDLEAIREEASHVKTEFLVTTEKDAMRLPVEGEMPRLGIPLLAVGIELRTAEGTEALQRALLSALETGPKPRREGRVR
ncbi:MAG: tetraacyldisaccharide 4'-kinase [Candidatus Eiseniibacteriota bacterium]|nr:MAG: tetraacyldisaccharide 4'-kinase [Candidatus Eisenbacteria bacterium]